MTDHLASSKGAARQPFGFAACRFVGSRVDIPPTRVLSSTILKLARQIGQLLALSTQGLRHSLCKLWPHGSKCATISSSLGSSEAVVAHVWGLSGLASAPSGRQSTADCSSLSGGPSSGWTRSPRQTMQVSAIVVCNWRSKREEALFDAIHKSRLGKVERRRTAQLSSRTSIGLA